MKKSILITLIILLFGFAVYAERNQNDPEITINDETIQLQDPVVTKENRTLVPAKFILEELGFNMKWDGKNKVASAISGDFRIDFPIGSKEVTINQKTEKRDVAAEIFYERTYVPVRALVETLGGFVEWKGEENAVAISSLAKFDPLELDDEEQPILNVAYPPRSGFNIYGSPLFVFGTTNSYSQVQVTVNGEPVEMLDPRSGNFLTMVEVPRDEEFSIKTKAIDSKERTTTVERSVIYPEVWKEMDREPLALHSTHLKPDQDQILKAGDTLKIIAQGSPDAQAEFWIGDEDNKMEMTELESPPWPLTGEGIYTGTYTIEEQDVPLAGKSDLKPIVVTLRRGMEQVTQKLPGKVSFLSHTPYKIVEVKEYTELGFPGWFRKLQDDNIRLHAHTRGGTSHPAATIGYLVEGTRFEVIGASGDYYRVKMEEGETVLVNKDAVNELEDKETLQSSVSEIKLTEDEDKVSIRLDTKDRIPFLIDDSEKQLQLELYRVEKGEKPALKTENLDSINTVKDLLINSFPGENSSSLKMTVELARQINGFECKWDDDELVLNIYKQLEVDQDRPLKDKLIVVDPGHGGYDPGAIGPADIHEKDVVLEMSLLLKKMLKEDGAEVIMTRTEDKTTDLYRRADPIIKNDADLFISVHANAHAHGANAVETHGLMTLYGYSHSEKLAEIMLDKLGKNMDLPTIRTWERNFAVLRYSHAPSVLVEAGYMKHPEDNWHILHPRGQKEFANAMKEGIEEYFLSFKENP